MCYKQKCKVVSLNLAHPVDLLLTMPKINVIGHLLLKLL